MPQRIDSPYVFEGTDPEKWFAKLVSEAGVQDFHWHDLRHTFGSRLAMAGVPILNICRLMGHSDVKVTMRYAHLQPGHLAEAVERLTESPAQTDTATDTKILEVSKAG